MRTAILLSLIAGSALAAPTWFAARLDVVKGQADVQDDCAQITPVDGNAELCLRSGEQTGRFRAMTWHDQMWYESTFWSGGGWCRVGKNWQHPGEKLPSVRRFTAPKGGTVTISGNVRKAHLAGDGIRAIILHGTKEIWRAELAGTDNKGTEPKLTCVVKQGDALRFEIGQKGGIACDTTYWEPVVTYADGTRFVAVESFGSTCGKENPWSYEADHGGSDPAASQVRAFTTDFAGYTVPVKGDMVGFSAQLSDHLPVWILSGATPAESVVLAMPDARQTSLVLVPKDGALTVATSSSVLVLPAADGWLRGLARLDAWLQGAGKDTPLATRVAKDRDALFSGIPGPRPDLALQAAVLDDWAQSDAIKQGTEACVSAALRHLRQAKELVSRLPDDRRPAFLAAINHFPTPHLLDTAGWERLYRRVRFLKRQILLGNPLVPDTPLLFTKRLPSSYSHLVMQYFGWRARPGGGIFELEEPGYSLEYRDLTGGKLAGGNVLEPRLSYDGRRAVFAYVECPDGPLSHRNLVVNEEGEDTHYYHIWELEIATGKLRQLTSGPYDDITPTYLPDGGIMFCSTRRRGYARCFGGQFAKRWHVYTLHRMDGDGGNIRTLSWHDTNEWFPTVANSGQVLYSRWDYIDRDAVTHQNLWATRPDGTNPIALWGNATLAPHCTFQLQPIPNSQRIVCTASAHHSVAGGSIAIIDPEVADNGQAAITRFTPNVPFPEAEGRNIKEYYAAPWPLSEKLMLVAYSPVPLVWEPRPNTDNALGLYLLDADGNRELLYRDPIIGSTNPIPLRPRACPPVLPSHLPDNPEPTGEMTLIDVYRGLGDVPRGTIKEVRVVQIFPKLSVVANRPPIGLAGEENGRAVLGTVPVAPDGSARFRVPAQKLLCFQALDEKGRAYQVMRTATYLQPGEKMSCIGCHENRLSTHLMRGNRSLAASQPAENLRPESFGIGPFGYARVVQPILDRHCIRCHGAEKPAKGLDLTGTPHQGFSRSYWSLCGDVKFTGGGTNPANAKKALVPRFGARNRVQITPPGGQYSARGSRLLKMLEAGHKKVLLTEGEFRQLAAWIDLNAVFYGSNDEAEQAAQLRGEAIPMPKVQ
jgi:hypothetical protein